MNPEFDPRAMTERLQEAVRTHDVARLQEMVSERMIFASSRSLLRLGYSGFAEFNGRVEWIAAATVIPWVRFDVHEVRAVTLAHAVVVDSRMSQVVRRDGQEQHSIWVVTDVWALEDEQWRLVARHPDLASTANGA
jgi:ketosteroid isomerase-like protein